MPNTRGRPSFVRAAALLNQIRAIFVLVRQVCMVSTLTKFQNNQIQTRDAIALTIVGRISTSTMFQRSMCLNPLTAGTEYIGVFTQLLPHSVII